MFPKPLLRLCKATFLAFLLFSLSLTLSVAKPDQPGLLNPIVPAQAGHKVEVQVFVLLDSSNQQHLNQVQAYIKEEGGRVIHTFPYQAVIANLPNGLIQPLATLPGVVMAQTETIPLSAVARYGPAARHLAQVWNSLVAASADPLPVNSPSLKMPEGHADAFVAPDLPQADSLASASVPTSVTPGYYQTSEFMAGSVAVGIVLLESDGSIDPSTEDWTAAEKQLVFSELVAALNWWAELEPRVNLNFVYDEHCFEPLPTGVEPITRPYSDQYTWIAEAMTGLGYNAPSYFTQVRDYNNGLRDAYQTDWAFTIFVVDSSADSDNYFSDGYFAYAYIGGPFLVLTYGNNGYGPHNMDAVAAHEVAHIFYALDQYSGACQPCTRRSGYLYVENQNSQYGTCDSNEASIMRSIVYPYATDAVDPYAAGQIGWRDSDGDDILDPLDTDLPVYIDTLSQDEKAVTVSGLAEIIPYPSAFPYHPSVTINRLTGVQYRLDGGIWQSAFAADGHFDDTTEIYHFRMSLPPPGLHTLEIAAVDSAGNVSDLYATETITVPDPVDGNLNTELLLPGSELFSHQPLSIEGIAYHMQDGTVANVEYRIDGGSWQPATAQDGDFDSAYETFTIALGPLEVGTYLVEAFATGADGQVESNIASQTINLDHKQRQLFLPVVIGGS